MNRRLIDYATSASRGNALTGLVVGWAIGKHIGEPWGITSVIAISTVYGFLVHSYLDDPERYDDWLGEFTNGSKNTTGENRE